MSEVNIIAGRVLEASRFINANKRGAPHWAFPERRELWLQLPQSKERKFVIHSRVLPARRGHQVTVLVHRMVVVAVSNETTGDVVNYAREDPVGLLRFKDFLGSAAVAGGGALAMGPGGALLGPAAWMSAWLMRFLLRSILQARVDAALDDLPPPSPARSPR